MDNLQNLFEFNASDTFIMNTTNATYGFNCEIIEQQKEPILIGIEDISDTAEHPASYVSDELEVYVEEMRSLKEIQEAENEMFEKVWYSRHKIFNDENCEKSPYIEGERQNILKIEKKYGKENLIVDAWTVAEWYGKLSALRWVLGRDWDFLDT